MQVSLGFGLKSGDSIKCIFTKRVKSDFEGTCISNFDLKAAQQIYIKFVRISEENLFSQSNCLKKLNDGKVQEL